MKNLTIPIILFAVTSFLVLIGGLIGGVSFFLIIKRIFIFGMLMAGLGFVFTFLIEKFSGESISDSPQEILPGNGGIPQENEDDTGSSEEQSEIPITESSTAGEDSGFFDYTVKDDDEIEFKPLDESVMKKTEKPVLDFNGEKIEIDPQKAAQAVRQLLREDGGKE